ncbi:PPOX class F420-dependent oxidoreductase [Carbonactinospora thermoautotrophica]|uniref:PPOX class F420-dependent oxidoreductase n=1 Tax=Carbonactinospora thermoautotrophica TaxID=1469144 RepID=UPI0022709367|nr:PPOX class F420-dependent oxidoreductase [Carbonactinospora thermoautotrophica]MCX9191005.1 PPOX class F420-dependent oxidoreductase [Carbonactinospora thermoautotrophica]
MAVRLSDEDIELLRKPVFAHVATVMPDGTPQVTPVWIDTDGEAVLFNTAKGRVKHRNLTRNPNVAVSLTDDANPYKMLAIRGRAELIEEGADEHIDTLAKKYLGVDTYPYRQPGEERVIVRITPTARAVMG